MAYEYLQGFMYGEVGDGVGAWLREGELPITPMALPDIVQGYVDNRSRFTVLMLKRDIRRYLRKNLMSSGVSNVAPFDYELCFSEHYFGCSTQQFLRHVDQLLDDNLKRTKWRGVKRLFNIP